MSQAAGQGPTRATTSVGPAWHTRCTLGRQMASRRPWIVVAAVLVALVTGVLLALPMAVRLLAERQAEDLLGRDVTIGDVDFNVFTRRLVATDVQVHGGPGDQAPLRLRRLESRF